MNKRSTDPARVQDAARLLPLVGVILLMPPVVSLFVADATVGGVPLIVVYLFCTWLALIGFAAWLARRLSPPERSRPGDSGGTRG
jgi:hypothetical protein